VRGPCARRTPYAAVWSQPQAAHRLRRTDTSRIRRSNAAAHQTTSAAAQSGHAVASTPTSWTASPPEDVSMATTDVSEDEPGSCGPLHLLT
jgi:hypothetical protein